MLLLKHIINNAVISLRQTRPIHAICLKHRLIYPHSQFNLPTFLLWGACGPSKQAGLYHSMSARSQAPAKPLPTDLPIRAFSSANDFEAFLDREHTTAAGIHLKLAKKSSGIASVSGADAVETALCFGWIDGRANPFDEDWWLLRFTPRRSKSMWSQKNVNTIERLMEQGRMRPAGLAAVESAKADGRWDRAYAGQATMTIPDDLATALKADSAASAFLDVMTKADRFSLLMRLQTASSKNRDQRIRTLVEKLAADHALSVLKSSKKTGVKKTKAKSKSRQLGQVLSIGPHPAVSNEPPTETNQPRRAGLRSRS